MWCFIDYDRSSRVASAACRVGRVPGRRGIGMPPMPLASAHAGCGDGGVSDFILRLPAVAVSKSYPTLSTSTATRSFISADLRKLRFEH